MNKKERATYIAKRLEELFPEAPVPLDHKDAYTLLVAVLLSAQCTDKKVNQVTPGLFELADNPAAMAKLRSSQILAKIKSCGLAPTKAKNIKALSKILIDQFAGVVPQSLEDLISLPGVGRKTALVVRSQWYGIPAFPVDTHIFRLAKAWRLSAGKNVLEVEKDLCAAFPDDLWNKLHLQIIFYGREYCTARQCDGVQCNLCQTLKKRKG